MFFTVQYRSYQPHVTIDDGLQTRVLVGDKQKYACLAYVLDVDLTGLVMD